MYMYIIFICISFYSFSYDYNILQLRLQSIHISSTASDFAYCLVHLINQTKGQSPVASTRCIADHVASIRGMRDEDLEPTFNSGILKLHLSSLRILLRLHTPR